MPSIKGIEFKVGTQKKIFSQSVTNEVNIADYFLSQCFMRRT